LQDHVVADDGGKPEFGAEGGDKREDEEENEADFFHGAESGRGEGRVEEETEQKDDGRHGSSS